MKWTLVTALQAALILATGCTADPPRDSDGSFPPAGKSKYASLAVCTPASPCGETCAQQMTGAADGKAVDMASCPVVDLTWTTGTIISQYGSDDLALHLGKAAGITRVEASSDGAAYTVAGFIGGMPPGTPAGCLITVNGTRALIKLDQCNGITNVKFLRLSRDTTVNGAISLDAAEALNFKPID